MARNASLATSSLATIALAAASLLAAALMLSWVALFNNAPLVFSDSLMYATAALQREMPGMFSVFYSIFILPLHQGVTLWPIVFVQGAMLAHLLFVTMRCVLGGRTGHAEFLLIVAVLSVFSSLPWITGQILPDVFAPVVLLGTFLLVFCKDELRRGELWYVGALTTLAISTHLSHVPIVLGLILLCLVLRSLWVPPQGRRWMVLLVAPFVLAIGAMLAMNWVGSREIGLARNSNVFLLAKWIDEGPALAYLTEACPQAGYRLCAHVEEMKGLTHDDLKWDGNSPLLKAGTFDQLEPEARTIVRATLRAYPFDIMQRAVMDAGRQLLRFEAGDGLSPWFAKLVGAHVGTVFGAEVGRSLGESKQGQDRLPIAEARRLHLLGLAFGVGVLLWSAWARRNALPEKLIALYVFVVAGTLWSAVVTGALSGPYDRYFARVVWLMCFVGLVGFCHLVRARRPGTGEQTI